MANRQPVDLTAYANQFDELEVEERTPVIDLNAINRLSELREDWQNVTDTPTEYELSTAANTDDTAYLETVERGQYSAGFQVQGGAGVRIPALPTGDSTIRWGYYIVDSSGDPYNGFYFGADSNGLFVAKAREGSVERIYQENWNRDALNGLGGSKGPNPSHKELDISNGAISQIEFTYYGYGPIEMQFLLDDDNGDSEGTADVITAHVFTVSGETSIGNTNLPLRQEIDSGGTNNDALTAYVGGRQFSIIGKRSNNERRNGHYVDSVSTIDDSKWYAAISFKLKDGTDIGSYDYRSVLAEVIDFEANPDANVYLWQLRRGTQPDAPVWENLTTAEDAVNETALKADTSSVDVQDGSGNLTGVPIDAGTLDAGEKNAVSIKSEDATGEVAGNEIVTLLFKASPASSGTISDIFLKAGERW